jgi:hypothetical protein
MTAYHGGKQRIGKEIAESIYKKSKKYINNNTIRGYCEPFCGMLGVYQHIPKLLDESLTKKIRYKASDINESVIKMWKKVKLGWIPKIKNVSKKQYEKLKYSSPSELQAFIGHQCSFGGKFFQHYVERRCQNFDNALKNLRRISKEIKNVSFSHKSYDKYKNLKNYIIYCDPPYSEYSDYYDRNYKRIKFDTIKFWKWCIKMAKNNLVFISEYRIPREIKKLIDNKFLKLKNILNIKTKTSYGRGTKHNIEKLYFIYNTNY